jgi:aromatic ring-opening dioxygenase LigB subunit
MIFWISEMILPNPDDFSSDFWKRLASRKNKSKNDGFEENIGRKNKCSSEIVFSNPENTEIPEKIGLKLTKQINLFQKFQEKQKSRQRTYAWPCVT